MAAVGRLLFGKSVRPAKHKWLLMGLGVFFVPGYPLLFMFWLMMLLGSCCFGRVAVGDGFLVVLSRRTSNPKPSGRDLVGGGLFCLVLLSGFFWLLGRAVGSFPRIDGAFWVVVIMLVPMLGSVLVRMRRDDLTRLQDVLVVTGFVPTGGDFRHNGPGLARAWLSRQSGKVGWVADEGLKRFYERVLAPWGVQGVLVNRGCVGFWGLLWPARYVFVKP